MKYLEDIDFKDLAHFGQLMMNPIFERAMPDYFRQNVEAEGKLYFGMQVTFSDLIPEDKMLVLDRDGNVAKVICIEPSEQRRGE